MTHRNHSSKGIRGLVAYEQASETCIAILNALKSVRAPGDLKNQIQRAVISIPLNIAEGSGRHGGDRKYHFSVAYGSGREAMAGLELIRGLGLMDKAKIADLIARLDRVNRLVWGLQRK